MKYLAAFAAFVVTFIIWRLYATVAGGRRAYARLVERIAPVTGALRAGRDPEPDDLIRFARDRTSRKVLYDVLAESGKLHLFPREQLTWEAMAESDLVAWLNHPHELGCPPDDIDLTTRLPAPTGQGHYFLFRYRTLAPHWAAGDGWKAGVAGPYDLAGDPVPHGRGTFSRFEAYESRTPAEHVAVTHRTVLDRKS